MTNKNHTSLNTGVTNNLVRGVMEHRQQKPDRFTVRFYLIKLVYYETTQDIQAAILREKQTEAGSRKKKMDLINSVNPRWVDLLDSISCFLYIFFPFINDL